MRYSLLVLVFILVGCGRKLDFEDPSKRSFGLGDNSQAVTISMDEFSNYATTFSMFFFPEENELIWKSNLYAPEDSYERKIANILKHIAKNSDEFDLYDKKILELMAIKRPVSDKYDELGCDLNYTPECEELDGKLTEINSQAVVTYKLPDGTERVVDFEGYKSYLIEEIQSSVDDYDRLNPELNRPKNWMLYGDAPLYEIRPLEKGGLKIVFPNLGPFESQNAYSTETGDIYDVKVAPGPYSEKVDLVTFKIKEKNNLGEYTGYNWEFTLERSFAVGKLRYKGDVLKTDASGGVIRRGMCKIDFARKGT